ncbi:IS66 family transposase [Coprobacillus cateniformis]|uniref:IS66 family transposase n=1 Tax=Coprobacillus cateniformis TaxID=100884 RepID=UPI00241FBBA1|nr:IS66 family transposase [Coprobacillus cateniformis]
MFGRSSEKSAVLNVGQLSLFDEAEMECDPELKEEITYQRAKRKRQKEDIKAKLDQLPQIDINYTLEDEHQICPSCGSRLKKVGKKLIRRELNYIPAKLEVHNIYQTTYECRTCKKGNKPYIYNAPIDAPVIPHSYATSESVAQVMVDKYVNCMPLYRQEQEWKRLGFQLSRATMANWIIIASNEWLTPIKDRMHELLLEENYTHADESPVQVLNETGRKNTTKSYMWVYATIKESKHPIRIFDYTPTRAGYNPKRFLNGFKGYVITDGYQAYETLDSVVNVFCWAHARRKFSEAIISGTKNVDETIAGKALNKIKELFVIEREIETLKPEEKREMRQKRAKPLVEEFFSWCDKNQKAVLTGSKTYKALQYALKHREGLSEYLEDGLLPMTNSLDERTIRLFAVGRKNWLFSTSTEGAQASATVYSIIQTAKANGLDPYKYLSCIFKYLPGHDIKDQTNIDYFLPWNKHIQEECK